MAPRSRGSLPGGLLYRALGWGVLLVIIWFYSWTVNPVWEVKPFASTSSDYYNLQVRGFLKGQTALDMPADPALATMRNPYDPGERAGRGLHDASYFRGRYHMYFGVTPVLVLLLPVRLLTGLYVNQVWGVLLFAVLGFLVAVGLLRAIIREAFPGSGAGWNFAALAAAGLVTMIPSVLRRPAVWEVPITAAYAWFMVALFSTWLATGRRWATTWAAVASVAMGLCVGARPVNLFGAVVILVPLALRAQQFGKGFWRSSSWWRLAAAVIAPIALIGLGLATYNYARFGNPLEFGQTYQMAGADDMGKLRLFSLGYLAYNLHLYLWSAPGLSPFFPFITVIHPPPAPPGQFGIEDPYGVVPAMPWVLLAVMAVGWAFRPRGRLDWWSLGAGASVLACLGTAACYGFASNRYMVDFVPGMSVLALIGALRFTGLRPVWRYSGLMLAALLLVWSGAFNVLASMQHNRLLQLNYPEQYSRVARAFNHVPAVVDRLIGTEYGPLEMRVAFPRDRVGKLEPLVTTGAEFLSDYIYVLYLPDDQIRVGFEHTSYGGGVGPPIKVDPSADHTVVVQMGSLFPPRTHPYFDGLDPEIVKARTQIVKVTVDGRTALSLVMDCYDAVAREPDIGTSGNRPAFKEEFTGRILGLRRTTPFLVESIGAKPGPLQLAVRFPNFHGRRNEPLLSMGETGKGDLIYVTYLDERHIAIVHDKWGFGGSSSEAIEIEPGATSVLRLLGPPLRGNAGPPGLEIWLNGRLVMSCSDSFHPSAPSSFVLGANRIGASTAEPVFTGQIVLTYTPDP